MSSTVHQTLVRSSRPPSFGFSVALENQTAVVGAYWDDTSGELDAGTAQMFVRGTNGTWSPQAKLLAMDGTGGDYFGYAVAGGDAGRFYRVLLQSQGVRAARAIGWIERQEMGAGETWGP